MKMTAIVCVVLVLVLAAGSGPALAQGGAIVLSSSDVSFDCDFTETVGAVNSIWVVHTLANSAAGSEFKVLDAWTPLGTVIRLGVTYGDGIQEIGNIYDGIAMSYGGCKSLPRILARLDFFVFSPTPECTQGLSVVANPFGSNFTVVALDCTLPTPQILTALGGTIWINVDDACACNIGAEETTWSRMKALYR